MRWGIFCWIIATCSTIRLHAQKTPHPEYLMKYYFTAVEGAKQSVIPPKNFSKLLGTSDADYFTCIQPEGLQFNQYLSQIQTGYDTILSIEEMISCGPFLAHRTEISNAEYKEFLKDSVWITEHLGYLPRQLFPDTNVWPSFAATPERAAVVNPYEWIYFQTSTYDQYPVVGVSQLQASAYCAWLTEQLKNNPKYSKLQVALAKAGLRVEASLPSVAEWMYIYESTVEIPSRKGTAAGKINDSYYAGNKRKGGGFITFINHQAAENKPIIYQGIVTNRGFGIQSALSKTLLRPSPVEYPAIKPYPAVSHLLGNVAEWTSTPAYGHLFNNKTTILNTNGQLIENAYQQVNVFDFNGYLVDAELLKQHYAIKGGSWAQDLHYLDPMSVMFMQSNHSNNHVGFRTVLHFYPGPRDN